MRWVAGIIDSVDMSLSKLRREWRTEEPVMLQFMESRRVKYNLVNEQQDLLLYQTVF